MSAILVIPEQVVEYGTHLALLVTVKQWEGSIRGPTEKMVITLPIFEDDMLGLLKQAFKATTVIFQHTYLIEKDEIEGRTLIIVP